MTYHIETADRRNAILKSLLEKRLIRTMEFSPQNLSNIAKNDCIIFSPAKKWTEIEANIIPKHTVLYCGKISKEIEEIFKKRNILYKNLLNDEIYTIKNANLTAEGVLALIIENSPKSLFENNIMILGAGRIAKALSILLLKLGVKHSLVRFNEEKFPECFTFTNSCFFGKSFENHISEHDVIVNTIPKTIFDEQNVGKIAKNTILIETASTDCINRNLAKHFNFIPAPALPQKYCAESAANIMLENILGDTKYV